MAPQQCIAWQDCARNKIQEHMSPESEPPLRGESAMQCLRTGLRTVWPSLLPFPTPTIPHKRCALALSGVPCAAGHFAVSKPPPKLAPTMMASSVRSAPPLTACKVREIENPLLSTTANSRLQGPPMVSMEPNQLAAATCCRPQRPPAAMPPPAPAWSRAPGAQTWSRRLPTTRSSTHSSWACCKIPWHGRASRP